MLSEGWSCHFVTVSLFFEMVSVTSNLYYLPTKVTETSRGWVSHKSICKLRVVCLRIYLICTRINILRELLHADSLCVTFSDFCHIPYFQLFYAPQLHWNCWALEHIHTWRAGVAKNGTSVSLAHNKFEKWILLVCLSCFGISESSHSSVRCFVLVRIQFLK